jgi:hypothetical protein
VKSISGYWLRSRFIREEVLRASVIVILFSWAVTASLIALLKKDRIILIGVADESSYVISQTNEILRRKEVVSFVRGFIASYYEFTPTSHVEKISRAGDLMTAPLWESKRAESNPWPFEIAEVSDAVL